MSDTQFLPESASWAHPETEGQAPSLRFTPLRSAAIARKPSHETGGDRILSRLVPVRRLQS